MNSINQPTVCLWPARKPMIIAACASLLAFIGSGCGSSRPIVPTEQGTAQNSSNTAPASPSPADSSSPADSNIGTEPSTAAATSGLAQSAGSSTVSASESDNSSHGPIDTNAMVSCSAPSLGIQLKALDLINEARSIARHCGPDSYLATGPLSWNDTLLAAAERQSLDMATHNFFSHSGSDGSDVSDRVTEAGYSWSTVGENIAAGQSTARLAIEGWINSPSHCRNLMEPAFTEIAVSCVANEQSDYGDYWTNVLAAPR